jgi:hypothetical protein
MARQEFSEEEAAAVLARAIKEQSGEGSVTWQDLLAIAHESGISEDAVRRAAEPQEPEVEHPLKSVTSRKATLEQPVLWWAPEEPEKAAQRLGRTSERVRVAPTEEGLEVRIQNGREQVRAALEPYEGGSLARPVTSPLAGRLTRIAAVTLAALPWTYFLVSILSSVGNLENKIQSVVVMTFFMGCLLFGLLSFASWIHRARRALARETLVRALRTAYGDGALRERESRAEGKD